ncbi:rod shape-determining protein MreC [Hugenholtzia roseola]|uniref:rod shape-determining protein MreC n=1 Tax=Hugenholtzia roseola TaxID=1002 RepID=UPI000402F123|nr:rod shape-determining protein MreC [Hugenholtzia roseola]
MQQLILLLVRFKNLLLFLFLELLCLILVVQNNHYQRTVFASSANVVVGSFLEASQWVTHRWNLEPENARLVAENARLRAALSNKQAFAESADSLRLTQYEYIPAKVVKNSLFLEHNYLTLNKGRRHGIKENMGVVSTEGIIGKVELVSENYATVRSLLHLNNEVSAAIKRNQVFGGIRWDGKSYQHTLLEETTISADIIKGDTVVTSAFNSIFPPNLTIGYVESIERSPIRTFNIVRVRLASDFSDLSYVYVIRNYFQTEQKTLESQQQAQ